MVGKTERCIGLPAWTSMDLLSLNSSQMCFLSDSRSWHESLHNFRNLPKMQVLLACLRTICIVKTEIYIWTSLQTRAQFLQPPCHISKSFYHLIMKYKGSRKKPVTECMGSYAHPFPFIPHHLPYVTDVHIVISFHHKISTKAFFGSW